MMQLTDDAEEYSPTGDPNHVDYGQDFVWSCTCGQTSAFVTGKEKAIRRAKAHEQHCDGETTVDVIA